MTTFTAFFFAASGWTFWSAVTHIRHAHRRPVKRLSKECVRLLAIHQILL